MDIQKICGHCMRESNTAGGVCPHCGKNKGQLPPVQHQLTPFTILQGKYLVGTVLGEGGFGITYIGLDINLEIRVAIKEFYPNGFVTREAAKTSNITIYTGNNEDTIKKWKNNFLGEARSLAKCANLPGVVGVKDFFQENNTVYIVQEFLEGQTLKDYVKSQGGKVGIDFVLEKMRPVIEALSEVHKQGIIHRDISPDNIMLLQNGSMKVLDFGAARSFTDEMEKSKSVMLKPGYAPEEQYRTKGNQGPWTDVYALTATIYRCITGVTPIESMERMRADSLVMPMEMGIPIAPWQQEVLKKGMAVFADQRYQSMKELYDALYSQNASVQNTVYTPNNTAYVQQPVYNQTVPIQQTQMQTVPMQQTQMQTVPMQQMQMQQNQMQQMQMPQKTQQEKTKMLLIIGGVAAGALVILLLFVVVLSQPGKAPETVISQGPIVDPPVGDPEPPGDPGPTEVPGTEKDDYFYRMLDEANMLKEQADMKYNSSDYYDASQIYYDSILKYMECYDYASDGDLYNTLTQVFDDFENATIESCELVKNEFASEAMYNELMGRYQKVMQLSYDMNNNGYQVNSVDAENKAVELKGVFRENFINTFNQNVSSADWRREEAFYLMEQAKNIGLFNELNVDDPLTLRYNYAKACMVAYHEYIEKRKPASAYNVLFETFKETDYNLILLAYMAEQNRNMAYHYETLTNMIRDYQGLRIGRDVTIENLYYFNDFGDYSIDSFNGIRPEYRETIRAYVRDVMNIY